MCLPIARYKKIISTLETVIYPSFIQKINELIIGFQQLPFYQSPVQLEKIQMAIDLRSELQSLQLYEVKFIFPLVLSLFNREDVAVKADYGQIAQLTRFKEDKIEKYSYQLQGLNNCGDTVTDDSALENDAGKFFDEVQTILLPIKRQWSFALYALAAESRGTRTTCAATIHKPCNGCSKNKKSLITS